MNSATRHYRSLFHLFALSLWLLPAGLLAQQTQQTEQEEEATDHLEVVVVTGSRQKGRTVANSPVPVDVLSAEEIANQGTTELNMMLANTVPSFNFPQPSITDGTDHIRPASLRGLSPDHTLVLINGKRRHNTAIVHINGSRSRGSSSPDLNTIPSAAIKRIEILRDGAAAQYGSDAIAGVMNIILRDDSEGGGVSFTYGQYNTDLPANRWSDADIPDRGTVKDGDTLTASFWTGFELTDGGFLTLAGENRDRDPTNRSNRDPRDNWPDGDPRNVGEGGDSLLNHRYGNGALEDRSLFANTGLPLGDDLELYGYFSSQDREGESAGFYRRAADPSGRNVLAIYPDGFLPLIVSEVTDRAMSGGLRGTAGALSYDASLTWGRNNLHYFVTNSLNRSLGAASPTDFDAGGLIYSQTVFNLDFTTQLGQIPLAFGLENRNEGYEIYAGELDSYRQGTAGGAAGSQVFPGFQPGNERKRGRTALSLYVEAGLQPIDAFTLDLAGRFEDYEDFGNTFNIKLAARYEFNEAFALRGAFSTGFRAPSLQQIHFSATSTNFLGNPPVAEEVGTFPVDTAAARALGAKDLEPEESENISLGLTWQVSEDFYLTLDTYSIEIEDRILLSENLGGRDDIVDLLPEGVSRARFFLNGLNSTVDGLDLVGRYDMDLSAGELSLTLGYNRNTQDLEVRASTEVLDALEDPVVLFARREQLRLTDGTPKDKLVLSGIFSRKNYDLTLRATRYGETIEPGTSAPDDEVLEAKVIMDANFSFKGESGWQLALGADNLLDTHPDPTYIPGSSNFSGTFDHIFAFSGFSPFGFNGRYLYARLAYQW